MEFGEIIIEPTKIYEYGCKWSYTPKSGHMLITGNTDACIDIYQLLPSKNGTKTRIEIKLMSSHKRIKKLKAEAIKYCEGYNKRLETLYNGKPKIKKLKKGERHNAKIKRI